MPLGVDTSLLGLTYHPHGHIERKSRTRISTYLMSKKKYLCIRIFYMFSPFVHFIFLPKLVLAFTISAFQTFVDSNNILLLTLKTRFQTLGSMYCWEEILFLIKKDFKRDKISFMSVYSKKVASKVYLDDSNEKKHKIRQDLMLFHRKIMICAGLRMRRRIPVIFSSILSNLSNSSLRFY